MNHAPARRRLVLATCLLASCIAFPGSSASEPVEAAVCEAPATAFQTAAGDEWTALLARANAARAGAEAGNPSGVRSELERVAKNSRAFSDQPDRARLLIHLGRSSSLLAAGPPRDELAALLAYALLAEARELAQAQGRTRERSYAIGLMGSLYEQRGRYDEALILTRRALMAALEADAPDALYRWQWQAGRIHRVQGRTQQALSDYRQAATTLGALRREAAGAAAGWELEGGKGLYLELVDLLLQRAAEEGEAAGRQLLLAEARDTLEAQKAEELTDYFRDECLTAQRKATAEDIPGTVVVYPIALTDRLEILVSGSGPIESITVPVTREDLTREVAAFREKLMRRTTREHRGSSHVLYEWLVRPIDALLEARAPQTLVFVPDGPLRTIPFSALRDSERGAYLIERYPVAIVPSLTLTDPRPLQDVRVRMLTAGLSESVEGFPALEFVPQEIELVRSHFPGRSLMNEEFVSSRFESEVEKHPFGIVHIASHAEFGGDASDSFLVAYDGRLPMKRLAEVIATTRFRREQPLELLTLSACETAVGNERAGLGLAGIALQAGARSALASLWSVNDEASTQLIGAFYAGLGKGEMSRAQALQAAQLQLLAHRGYRHPAFWSSFVLISSWL